LQKDKPDYEARAGTWAFADGVHTGKAGIVSAAFPAPPDYRLRFTAKPNAIGRLQLRFRDQGPSGGGCTLVIDLKHQTTELRGPLHTFERAMPIPRDQPVTIEAFVLGTVIECFVNDAHAFTMRAYDFKSGTLSVTADEGGISISKLEMCLPAAAR